MMSLETAEKIYLAVDLGAGSGRVMAAGLVNGKFELEEVRRFSNPAVSLPNGLFWNIQGLFLEITQGITSAIANYGEKIVSLGVDTWGCDFGLIGADGDLLACPHQYRDPRFEVGLAEMHRLIPEERLFALTGLKTNFYNTAVHLVAEKKANSPALANATQLLFIPDLLAYWLTGKQATERTVASTSQLLDAKTGDWSQEVISELGLPKEIFGHLSSPGTILGDLRPELTGGAKIAFVTCPSHDTAAAVAGIPLKPDDNLWLSSGTWSIMGVEITEPIRSEQALKYGFCNELGIGNTVRFLKNISGLWIIQECKRYWDNTLDTPVSFAELASQADECEHFFAFIDPDAPEFAEPGNMPQKVQDYCQRTGQKTPQTLGQISRVVTDSLALKYRLTYERIVELTGKSYTRLNAGGGGIQNRALCQSTANALGIEVSTGPIEATACGNFTSQLVATQAVKDFDEGRELIRQSFTSEIYQPQEHQQWSIAYAEFLRIIIQS